MHYISSLAGLAAKSLAEQVSDIWLVVHDQDTHTHEAASAIVAR
jgi:hypothetical protein